jgi:hypothetical protein
MMIIRSPHLNEFSKQEMTQKDEEVILATIKSSPMYPIEEKEATVEESTWRP